MSKKLNKIILAVPALALALSTSAFATSYPHSDAATADKNTVKTRTVAYTCQAKKTVKVKYGFDKKNKPTYAQAKLNGKTRFMPINHHLTDIASTQFGDENNFSLMADAMNYKNAHKASMSIQSPSSEILYKLCSPKK